MRGGGGLHRALLICIVLIALLTGLILAFGPSHTIGYTHSKVVNDTKRTLTVQPCWDQACLSHVGLRTVVVPPGKTPRVTGKFANDVSQTIVVAILGPSGHDYPPFAGCVTDVVPAGTKVAVFRLSRAVPCLVADPTGPGG